MAKRIPLEDYRKKLIFVKVLNDNFKINENVVFSSTLKKEIRENLSENGNF